MKPIGYYVSSLPVGIDEGKPLTQHQLRNLMLTMMTVSSKPKPDTLGTTPSWQAIPNYPGPLLDDNHIIVLHWDKILQDKKGMMNWLVQKMTDLSVTEDEQECIILALTDG